MYRKKTTVIVIMCLVVVFMAVGYALLSTKLKINGSTAVTSSWQVEFSEIRTANLKGGATNATTPKVTATTATFKVDLVQPGDEVTYEIDITNYGDIVAEIKNATYVTDSNAPIYVSIEGVRKGTIIGSCEGLTTCPKVTATLKVGYDPSVSSDPSEKSKNIEITLNIGQYVPSSPTADGELIPELKTTLVQQIFNNNNIMSDSSIDFSTGGGDTNGVGLYYTSTNTEGNKPTYYFRGNVKNNYVQFGGITFRIVRINENGSVRLITEDSIGSYAFNTTSNDNNYIGFWTGAVADTYPLTHTNQTASNIVNSALLPWITSTGTFNGTHTISTSLLDTESGFCNDRSVAPAADTWISGDTAKGYGTYRTYYGGYNRANNTKIPQFACPQTEDLFTASTSSNGNKKMGIPVGLITMDEAIYSGVVTAVSTEPSYLKGKNIFTMTPIYYNNGAQMYTIVSAGLLVNQPVTVSWGVYPVINLKSSVNVYPEGDGTIDNPYIVIG